MLDWLSPQTVAILQSKFNGEIKVVKTRGQYAIWVGGFEQSGLLVENVWQKGLREISFLPKNILILGLGGGTLAQLINNKWPSAKMTGVEIDPAMIKLGKKYFGLSNFKNLEIIIKDVNLFSSRQKFDLVLVDLYRGGYSKKFSGKKFLSKNGVIIANVLTFPKLQNGEYNKLLFFRIT